MSAQIFEALLEGIVYLSAGFLLYLVLRRYDWEPRF